MKIVTAAQVAPTPWKNGGGVTRELLKLPDGDDWALRISVADIAADGPFSPFPGVTRWFAVLEGAGVRLAWPGHLMDLRPGDDPVRFDGGDAPGCTLVGGTTRDLNVMVRRDKGRAQVTRAALDARVRPAGAAGAGLFALRPLRLHGATDTPLELPALSLAWQSAPIDPSRRWWIAAADDAPLRAVHTPGLPGYWISLHATAAP